MDVMKYKIKDASNDGLYMRDVAEQFYADRLLEIYDNNGMLHERVGVIVVDEGDINCFIKVLGFYQALKDRLFKSSVSRLILIYENKSSLENDPYSYQFGKSVLLTDLESLSSGKKMIFREFINLNGTRNVSYTFKSKQPVSID